MSNKIKTVRIVFENCELVEIPINLVKAMALNNVAEDFFMSTVDCSLISSKTENDFYICLDPNFAEITCDFSNTLAKDRILQYNDITQIVLVFDDTKSLLMVSRATV